MGNDEGQVVRKSVENEGKNMKNPLIEIVQNGKRKCIAIYGGTKSQKAALRKALKFAKIYDMDLEQTSVEEGVFTTIEEVKAHAVDAFILLRQMIARQDIFSAMMAYCRENDAVIYDEQGNCISEICTVAMERTSSTQETLESAIDQHDCISFDIFDTLLTRKVLLPTDVFELVERRLTQKGISIKQFVQKRNKAQEELGLTNPDIHEIYARFGRKYKISQEVAEICIQMELAVEKEVLVTREDMLAIYQKCLALGKKVYLVSDMYIPTELLAPILQEKGITGYEKLYVSCDRKQLKLQGLLTTWKQETNGERYLHIGDHLIHDGICAGIAGVDYCLIANGYKVAQKTLWNECMQRASNLEERVMLGLVIAKVLNSPFVDVKEDGTVAVNSDYDFGYGFCAALVSQFALWIYEQVKEQQFDDILFAARDGYLMQQMYQILCEARTDSCMPKGKYFYTSRKAAVMTGINNEAFINMIIDISKGMPPVKMMRERFGLHTKDIKKYDVEKYGDSVHAYVWDHADAIFKRADEAKINYFKYMGQAGLAIGKKYAFMDFVSSGTSQKALARMAPFEIRGLYAGWNGSEQKEEVGVCSMFEEQNTFFMRRFKIMETFMTSQEPSLNYFDGDGKPVFALQDRAEKELTYISNMHKACLDFFRLFLSIVGPEGVTIHNTFTDSVFAVSQKAVCQNKECMWNHLTLMDDWQRKKNKVEQMIQ